MLYTWNLHDIHQLYLDNNNKIPCTPALIIKEKGPEECPFWK